MRYILTLLLAALALTLTTLPTSAGGTAPQAIQAVNEIRRAHGLPALSPHPALQRAASEQSQIMAKTGRMAHTAARGYDFARRLKRVGYRGLAAENIARGQPTLGRVLKGWMNSSGHRRNMLHPRMRYFGLAAVKGKGRIYWAMVLGG